MKHTAEFLVFGATGQQGGAVARALRRAGRQVRAFVRDPHSERASELAAEGITLAVGNLFDRASIERAMEGIKGVFSVQPSSPGGEISDEQEVIQGKSIADSALVTGVSHLVYSSSMAAGKGPTGMGHFDSKSEIEDYLRSLPLATTITRPASFMEMMLLPGMGLNSGNFYYFMKRSQAMQMIALHDLGRINAHILCNPECYTGMTLELAGQALTGEDLERNFSDAAGQLINYCRFPDALLEQNAFLHHLTLLVDKGIVTGSADIPALEKEFGTMMTMVQWLAGPAKQRMKAALKAPQEDIVLR